MVCIISHPCLQHAGTCLTHGSTAVNEGLVHTPDFCDVSGDENQSAIWQGKSQRCVEMLAEMRFEFSDVHGVSGEVEEAQQPRSRTMQQAGIASSAPMTGAMR